MHGDNDRDELSRAIRELACAVSDGTTQQKMEFHWMVTHHNFATKHDLAVMEARIIAAIKSDGSVQISPADQKILDDSLAVLSAIAKRVEKLDAAYPPAAPVSAS